MATNGKNDKSLESWIWDAACSIRGAKDAPKYKEFILPLIFAKRLCDVFDDELNRIAKEVGSRAKAFKLVKHDKKLVRFFLPQEPKNPDAAVWSVIRTLSDKIGEQLTTHLRAIADANPLLKGIILFLNKAKPKERQGKLFLLNASREFAKGDPKNYIPDDAILRIADTFKAWREEEKYSRIVTREEIVKNDFNISPSRYIHTGAGEEYRPIAEIMEELEVLDEEAKTTDALLKGILAKLAVS